MPEADADVYAAFARGNLGKAISLASSEEFQLMRQEVMHLLKHLKDADISELLDYIRKLKEDSLDIYECLDFMQLWYRDVLLYKVTKDMNLLVFKDEYRVMNEMSKNSGYDGLERILESIDKARTRLDAKCEYGIGDGADAAGDEGELKGDLRSMIKVIGVRFRNAGKIYYFAPGKLEIKTGDHVIVETARGVEYGYVVLGTREVEDSKVVQPLKSVIRMANREDRNKEQANRKKEKDAFAVCQEKIRKHNLEMKLIDVEYTFDNNKILFYFTADGRIDFRELVKDLASVFKTRIELRQVGVRDETKIVGGVGICGRALCCHSYLSEFIPVSMKMAKEQNLSLNPTKISGVCGRLMCCLKNEEETYEYLNSKLPGIGDYVTTDDGLKGEVQSVNVLRQLVKVIVTVDRDEKEIREYKAEQLKFRPRRKKGKGVPYRMRS